jgi:large subunit ribosomal protein L24
MAKLKIKKGDLVQVISGRQGQGRGKQGKVIAVDPDTERVLVEGVNRVTKHVKAGGTTNRGTRTGGLIHTRGPDPREQRSWSSTRTRTTDAGSRRRDRERSGRSRRSVPVSPCEWLARTGEEIR